MTALLLEKSLVTRELMDQVRREKQLTEEALHALERYPFSRPALEAVGIPKEALARLRFSDDEIVLASIIHMRWDAFKKGIEKSLGAYASMLLFKEIE